MPLPPPTASATDSALARVFARPELAEPVPSPVASFLSRVWEAVGRFWDWLFPETRLGETAGRVVFWVVLVALVVAGMVIAVRLLVSAAGSWRARERGAAAVPPGDAPVEKPTRASEWEALARRAAGEGRWREAALALYQALLFRLHEGGSLRYDPAKTPGDYRRELRRRGGDAPRVLDAFLRGFEPVAFGGRALDAEGYGHLREAAARAGTRG